MMVGFGYRSDDFLKALLRHPEIKLVNRFVVRVGPQAWAHLADVLNIYAAGHTVEVRGAGDAHRWLTLTVAGNAALTGVDLDGAGERHEIRWDQIVFLTV